MRARKNGGQDGCREFPQKPKVGVPSARRAILRFCEKFSNPSAIFTSARDLSLGVVTGVVASEYPSVQRDGMQGAHHSFARAA
ncbi:MAG: hypothetical protein UX49_C0010G0005 [Candidatus Wolfebacteria bacterium GW2011_GWC2_46_275]|uniref:Uncharacterized protein n=1 Tax=Candidatus Wolfebacteria bacterium GW2011_GWB1_47_1 TaxID=1619007 RepID=A0A0G4AQX1_9BACT|nr:MAG: hypothetical protein UX70_C0001G0190 [Candidatus Wolfebacteria bacterium GW2011_GWB1_47_1]KKU36709.1 MAG: hypothetical protein UX49_C0010G0005 [Candidatus Wolfebacteria bacterium GW2011_GWC2_46_275]KKU76666.1 MAG: hypothetical protein UY00_C0005G0016 [Candidatus Wolfebacteria bacterium GW2011_GWA1_47_6]HAL24381.1 hypothetical protein [Candidatus Wolfebacteria bacterium]HBD18058.1 hypothetical protein [Candidatus Wolfebacteria bacterium]